MCRSSNKPVFDFASTDYNFIIQNAFVNQLSACFVFYGARFFFPYKFVYVLHNATWKRNRNEHMNGLLFFQAIEPKNQKYNEQIMLTVHRPGIK